VSPDPGGSFFERSPDPVVRFAFEDGEAVVRAVNPAFAETFARPAERVVGEPLDGVVEPVGRDASHAEALGRGEAVETELRCRTADGVGVFLVRSTATDEDGGYAVYTEISEHKRVEERFSALVNSSTDVLTILDREGTVAYVSPSVEEVLGCTPDELVGDRALDWVHPEDRDAVVEEFFEDPAEWSGETRTTTYRFRDLEGGWRAVEAVGRSRVDDPAVEGVVINARDVTDRERRKQELETFETVVKTVPVGVLVLDEKANVEWINERGAAIIGMDPGELAGLHFVELVEEGIVEPEIVEEYQGIVRDLVSSSTDAETKISEVRIRPVGTDEERIVDAHFGLLPFEEEYRGTVNVFHDITERKRYERALEEKNDRLEEFASFVSHDLRNPLNVAQGYAAEAAESGDPDAVAEVQTSLERMEQLIGELLTMARKGRSVGTVDPLRLADVVEAAWATVETGDATLSTALPADPMIRADESLLRQLFENLFRNSAEHAGPAASVTVGTLDGGFYVADDGPGIDPGDRETVFELGYTTREGGTGFGLGIVEQVADAHGWSVDLVESEAGGARFEVTGVEFLDG